MKNPTQFDGGTSFNYKKPIDRSHPAKDLKDNGTRTEKMTSWSHSGKIAKSSTGRGDLVHNDTRTEMATPYNYAKRIDHSGYEGMGAPREVKKWHKKGKYDMSLPTTLSE